MSDVMSEAMLVKLIKLLTLGIGGLLFLIGIGSLINRKKKEKNFTEITYGKVTDVVKKQSYDSDGGYSSSWHTVFEYKIGDLQFVKESLFGSSQAKFAIGQEVKVHYNPEDYNEYYVAEEKAPKMLGEYLL